MGNFGIERSLERRNCRMSLGADVDPKDETELLESWKVSEEIEISGAEIQALNGFLEGN